MRLLSLALLGLTLLAGCSSNGLGTYGQRGRDVYGRSTRTYPSSRNYPASARTTRGGQARYAVCHNGRNSLVLPESAVEAHLGHGDRFGNCSRQDRRDDRRDDDHGNSDHGHGNSGHGNGRGNH